MRCIFCLTDNPPGNEHVFPQAIGGSFRIDSVCDSCNAKLGTVADAPLTDHLFVINRRAQLKLASYSGKVPDAALALLGNGGILASDPSQRIQLFKDPRTGRVEPRTLYNCKTVTLADGTTQRQIIIDASGGKTEIRKILMREFKRAKRDNPAVSIPIDAELDQLVETCSRNIQTTEQPEVSYSLQIDTWNYRRGILKIAYELACRWLGESYIDDPMAGRLRTAILKGGDPEALGIRGHIEFGCEIEPLRWWASDKDCHVAFSSTVGGQVMAIAVKIFDVFSAIVVVSEHPAKYARGQFDTAVIRFIHIDPVSGTLREGPVMEEFGKICRELRTSGGAGGSSLPL